MIGVPHRTSAATIEAAASHQDESSGQKLIQINNKKFKCQIWTVLLRSETRELSSDDNYNVYFGTLILLTLARTRQTLSKGGSSAL